MTEHQWGDPDAPFPYCLSHDEYQRQMAEIAFQGLTDHQLDGTDCIECGRPVEAESRVMVGVKLLQYAAADGTPSPERCVLYADPICAEMIFHPSWCDREHEPRIEGRGIGILDFAIHHTTLATFGALLGSSDEDLKVEIIQHERENGELSDPYLNLSGTDLEVYAPGTARDLAKAILDAAPILAAIEAQS